jgi:hypothetical protein
MINLSKEPKRNEHGLTFDQWLVKSFPAHREADLDKLQKAWLMGEEPLNWRFWKTLGQC